jgi:hypothetical protein
VVLRSLLDMGIMLVNGQWLGSFCQCAQQKAGSMTAGDVADLLAALAAFGYRPDAACAAALTAQAAALRTALTLPQLQALVLATLKLGLAPHPELLDDFFRLTAGSMPTLGPAGLSEMAQGLAKAGVRPDEAWLQALVERSRAALYAFNMIQLDELIRALMRFEEEIKADWLTGFVAYLKEFLLY